MALGDCPVCGKENRFREEIKVVVKDENGECTEIILPSVHLLCLLKRAGIAKPAEG